MCIYLVRHGQTIGNLKNELQGQLPGELSEFGGKQAEQSNASITLLRGNEQARYDVEFVNNTSHLTIL